MCICYLSKVEMLNILTPTLSDIILIFKVRIMQNHVKSEKHFNISSNRNNKVPVIDDVPAKAEVPIITAVSTISSLLLAQLTWRNRS